MIPGWVQDESKMIQRWSKDDSKMIKRRSEKRKSFVFGITIFILKSESDVLTIRKNYTEINVYKKILKLLSSLF